MTWSAAQYSTFENERTRPVRDLVAALPNQAVASAVDLGCGPGNSTQVLAGRYPGAQVSGLDSSEDMIVAARQRLPQMAFEVGDIGSWRSEQGVDVILANASLQWLPDHAVLYPRLVRQLAVGGSLAIQTPDNLDEPAHRQIREIAKLGTWASKVGDLKLPPRHTAAYYYDVLSPHCRRVDVWRTTYYHPLVGGAAAVVEWFKGSALRPYLAALEAQEQADFLQYYLQAMEQAYPPAADGTVLLPFPRLFIVATR
ncbi:trans-aconitate 2-methyltransferase [Pseudomonas rubra]|uniref:Trans-aconitate 2-methyltransferase n=1 Tax=Pseudomonas rubra TaxID=2942627 RepID=A0ABT5PAW3_9PSED|nr:trans-aconitate 2-methyltransferase [Pseudomonas rubra]MDD1015450.1 trans-aconitate 2-methyltransferase [Pseudomonas rubra]MDD1041264.1 trans-aconitate 2-methyltransferase [Pseudomonas rubra]MDD1153649.1 trans-aconitate 2-methyltransferase [Pseudomonas rubra]